MPRNGSVSFRNCGLFSSTNPVLYEDKYKKLIKIIILREPIERVVSLFMWKQRRTDFAGGSHRKKHLDKFETYLLGLIKDRNELTYPQSHYLFKKDLTLADIEEVFTLDNYNNDVRNFSTKYNLDLDIGHLNQSNREDFDNFLQFINDNDDIKNRLTEIYGEDIELYNSQTKKK
jgi:hypothetical protein